jgi:hypothetical protein
MNNPEGLFTQVFHVKLCLHFVVAGFIWSDIKLPEVGQDIYFTRNRLNAGCGVRVYNNDELISD